MSRRVVVQFEIRDMLILKDTLTQLGHRYTEIDQDVVEIQRSYHAIRFDAKTGEVAYDDMNTGEVNKIKQGYMVNFYRDRAIKEGMQIKQTTNANGEIEIYLTR